MMRLGFAVIAIVSVTKGTQVCEHFWAAKSFDPSVHMGAASTTERMLSA
jgi:hypothetical protein